MKIAFCSSEVFPFAKTGGLADVSGSLPQALAKKGCTVKVFMPLYSKIKPQKVCDSFGYTKEGNVEFYFIKNDAFFIRDQLYGTSAGDYPDNLERFTFLSKQVLALLKELDFAPDILHCNDWQSSLIPVYLKTTHANDPFFKKTRSVLTIHNLAYQGLFPKEQYAITGLPGQHFNCDALEFYGKVNLLKGGIVFSDMVNTVSPNYAKQIQTSDYGCGLEGVLREKRGRLCGILNAIDYTVWNPKKDPFIYKQYGPSTMEDKYVNKRKFQKELGLKVDKKIPLLGMVTRLAEQKGVDILSESLDYLLKKTQVVILGLGEEKYHQILKKKQKKFKDAFSLNLKFDEGIAHKIYAASDCFLMPSRFEPCGLSQLISYKYATIPLVHHTGGLVDTVGDISSGGGGFVFTTYSSDAFISAVERAHDLFLQPAAWGKLLKKVTKYNFSWDVTAQNYMQMYKTVPNNNKKKVWCGR